MAKDTIKSDELFICGGCNAKIGPGNLSNLLKELPKKEDPNLLVGYDSTDDAAVYKLTDDLALISTLDFFPTMVSDPYLFGKIAATNALSDVYAMGGEVINALNIVAYPEEKGFSALSKILKGGTEKVHEAGAVLAGGHSIHDSLPKYGLSVSGIVHPDKIWMNNTSQEGDALILTKPLGVGIVTTAYSVGETSQEAFDEAVKYMTTLNKYAAEVMKKFPVHSCTDVTGFGLLGHLNEMMNEAFTARLKASQIPYIKEAYRCASEFLITAGGQRNRNYLSDHIQFEVDDFPLEEILFDPQTSGGLLFSLPSDQADAALEALHERGIFGHLIGHVVAREDKAIIIEK
ncbi:selenide, water dikinase SelD [Atopobacter sp. AH10]|uniref:selenide, water dikinase SelD n=1 Tax=Atopobacter sp. AH10 TaxID=2315861 RepID=UPI000EF193BA|nr:selenide, water dikinase SelD [Atopobacter sp. AH10]RLK64115.1 selenide, water dikinase SelD [Atopobacter sp. AH10]